MKKLSNIMALAVLLTAGSQFTAQAQDPHLSQYYSSPLYLNPALTGMVSGAYRVNANYKSQWQSIGGKGYSTLSASFDTPLDKKLGIGGYVIHQAAGDAGFKNTNVFASASYHVNFGYQGTSYLVFGLQGGIVNKSFDIGGAYFDEQYVPGIGYDPSLPSGEAFSDNSVFYPDFNAGVFYFDANPMKNVNAFFGYAVSHLLQPKESLFNSNNKIPMRHLVHGGAKFRVSSNFDFTPHVLFMQQKKAREVATGLYGEYHFPFNNAHLLFGATYRWVGAYDGAKTNGTGAIIPYAGFQVADLLIGLSYDINTAGLNQAIQNRGGLEISLSFVPPGISDIPKFFCPRL